MWYHSFSKFFFILILWNFFAPLALGNSLPKGCQAPSENPNFIGREAHLKRISDIFQNHASKIAVLGGGPGFGKSQIARKYLHQNYHVYEIVWWFRASQYIEPQFRDFSELLAHLLNLPWEAKAQTMSLKRLQLLVHNAIRKNNVKCLMVYDNVVRFEDIENYIPYSHDQNVHVLITTQNNNFSTNKIIIPPFTQQEAIQYITQFLGPETLKAKKSLAKHVYHHPATLKFAVDYINHYPGMTIDRYVKSQEQKHSDIPASALQESLNSEALIDEYKTSLVTAIRLNLEKLKLESPAAHHLLCFLTLLHRDQIQFDLIRQWGKIHYPSKDLLSLIKYIKKYAFLESVWRDKKVGAYVSMHELIQKITSTLIAGKEKEESIDYACFLLKDPFSYRSDLVVEYITRNNIPLLNAERVLEEAHRINYRTPALTRLRAQVFDVVSCGLRDFEKAKNILEILQEDLRLGIKLSKKDYSLYLISLSFFAALYQPDYNKAIKDAEQALTLLDLQEDMQEEKVRLMANLMQFYCFQGELETCEKLYQKAKSIFPTSKSNAYNGLFVYATALYFLDLGKPNKTIELVHDHQNLLKNLNNYPSMRFYILKQLADAYIKNGKLEQAQTTLDQAEKDAKEFYENENNPFFAHLKILKAWCQMESVPLDQAIQCVQHSLKIYEQAYHGSNKHLNQAEAHLVLGKFYDAHGYFELAKRSYLTSEEIFEILLKKKTLHTLSELYKDVAILGAKIKDEGLTHTYLKKQMEQFGLENPHTQEIILFLDKKGLGVPL